MSPSLSQHQFEYAKKVSNRITSLFALRDRLSSEGLLDNLFVTPSNAWSEHVQSFAYVLQPSYDIFNTLRLHTHFFTGHLLYPEPHSGKDMIPPPFLLTYWRYVRQLPDEMIVRPPEICMELGWRVNRGIINADTLATQRHLTALYRSGILGYLESRPISILEIGGGYGALAYSLKKILPTAQYSLVDLPEALWFQGAYLSITLPEYASEKSVYDRTAPLSEVSSGNHFSFIPHFLFSDMKSVEKFDLIINTGSFGEMTHYQVEQYVDAIYDSLLKDGGILYEENADREAPSRDIIAKKFGDNLISLPGGMRVWAKDSATLHELEKFTAPETLSLSALVTRGTLKLYGFFRRIDKALSRYLQARF